MRLPNGFGSVYKLSGKRRNPWAARKTIDWKDDEIKKTSVPVYQFIGYFPTRQEALTALISYNKDPYDLRHDTITFGDVYEKWSDMHYQKVSTSTVAAYKQVYKLCGSLEKMTFRDIKLDHLQKMVDDSRKNTPQLRTLKALLSLMYEYAAMHEIIPGDKRNMIEYLNIDKGNPNKKAHVAFTTSEIENLWQKQDVDIYVSVALILIYTGVRINELLDLKKEDVHLDERWFYISKSKTAAGIREVPIAEKIVPLFEYWLSRPCEHLICSVRNNKMEYVNFFNQRWKPMMQKLEMTHMIHDTRHTCISLLTAAKVDERIIRSIVGHTGTGVTEKVYTHIELPVKLEAINKIC